MNKKILGIIFGIMFIVALAGMANAFTWDGRTVAYYPMNESSGNLVDIVGANNAVPTGTPSYSQAGKIGTAVYFDETDYATPSAQIGFQDTDTFTINFWYKGNLLNDNTYGYGVFGWDNGDTYAQVGIKAGKFSYVHYNGGWNPTVSTTTVSDNTYHMLTLVNWANATGVLYVDGTPEVYDDFSITALHALNISTFMNGYGNDANGTIEEISFFNESLEAYEVTQLYNSTYGLFYGNTGVTKTLSGQKLAPSDNSVVTTDSTRFVVNSTAGDYNFTYIEYYLWDADGLNKTETFNITGDNYNLSNQTITGLSELKSYEWNALVCMGDGNKSSSNCTWADSGTNWTAYTYIEINVLDYANNHVDSVNMVCADASFDDDITSPYRTALSTFTSQVYQAMNCTFTDLQNYNKVNTTEINFSQSTFQYNITMAQKELLLNYYFYNGTSATVTGYYSDGNVTGNFTDTNFTSILQDLVQGKVRVMFGYNETVLNYTQYYEYENDWITNTEENITVLENVDTSAYIKVIDESGNPIDDVLVRVAFSTPTTGGLYKEMGQRFTGSDGTSGMTSFFFDSNSDVAIRFTKDGYTAKTIVVDIGANTYTFAEPLNIVLTREETTVYKGVFVRTYNYYNTNMSLIPLSIYAPSRSTVKYTTGYRNSLGIGNATITLDEFKKGIVNLTRGVDYCSSCTSDLAITIYVDGIYWGVLTVPFQATNEDLFTEPTGLDNETELRLAWIALLLLSGIGGLLLKSGDESLGAGAKGTPLFFIGALLISILFISKFTFLLVVTLLYGAGTFLRKLIGE